MPEEGFKRKLVAILSADAVGYSRLTRDDEEATVRELNSHRALISEIIDQYGGKVIDSPGDNLLAEFASVVDAVNSAVKIQEKIKLKNAVISDNRRMEFRIGINLGDVIDEEGRIYGDGVNIAARVEKLSAAGGISISGTVYEHIKNKLLLGYHFLGEQNVKNIPESIQVYQIIMESETTVKTFGEKPAKSKRRYWVAVLLAVMFLGALATAAWIYTRSGSLDEKKAAGIKGSLHSIERASIVVLPFSNLSGDPEQEYFSDGITNDLITDLSKFKDLLVIASNTIFTYKAKSVNIENVGEELGVRYVLEGSVQKVGSKVRVNAQLINAATGFHLWSERE
ncbi:MAG: adenylate/guanylate cyclase domain-containing protein [Planctomycetota bacterium]|jgi:adenylate cyclase